MKYVAVIFLCLFGLVELILRGVTALCTMFLPLIFDEDFMSPYCFKLADAIARGW